MEYIFPEYRDAIWTIELWITGIFIVEYALRWYSAKDRLRYPFTFYAVIDLIAILPPLLVPSQGPLIFSVFREVRLLRLMKIIRYSFLIVRWYSDFKVWLITTKEKNRASQLMKIFVNSILIWILGSNLIYYTEYRMNIPPAGAYQSYWQSYWEMLIVLFSGNVGNSPLSLLARMEVGFLLVVSMCISALITAEIVTIMVKHIERGGRIRLMPAGCLLENHIIIIGQNRNLHNVITQINYALKNSHHILVVSRDAHELKIIEPSVYKKVMALQGDALNASILESINLKDALRVVLLSSSYRAGDSPSEVDNRTLMKTIAVVGKNTGIPIVAELQNKDNLYGASTLEEVEFVVSRLFGERLISQAVLNPGVSDVYDSLMTFTDDSSEFFTFPVPDELVGKTFVDAQLFFLDMDHENIILVGIDWSPSDRPTTRFKLSPYAPESWILPDELILDKNDRLIVIAYEQPSFVEVTTKHLWRGKINLGS
jgi:voltage-gated potassium channel